MTDDRAEAVEPAGETTEDDDFGATFERIATALEQIAYQLKELRILLSKRLK